MIYLGNQIDHSLSLETEEIQHESVIPHVDPDC